MPEYKELSIVLSSVRFRHPIEQELNPVRNLVEQPVLIRRFNDEIRHAR